MPASQQSVELERRDTEDAWDDVLRTPSGRRVLADIIYHLCGLERVDYDASAKLHLIAGRRQVGYDLLRTVQATDHFSRFAIERAQSEGLLHQPTPSPEEDTE